MSETYRSYLGIARGPSSMTQWDGRVKLMIFFFSSTPPLQEKCLKRENVSRFLRTF